MKSPELVAFWKARSSGRPDTRSLRQDAADLVVTASVGLTDWQLQWLIVEYMKTTAFPTAQDFCAYARETRESVPEDLVCGAHLSGHPQVIALADELETLRAAWFEDERAQARAENIARTLKEVLR
jgi:hypothetical protein